ncbi:MAG: hypothetical protein E7Z85_02590 [Methanosphaera stadtmanae]|nr:hypothetical protein [Methanosphaera stadtmanae]
MNKKLIIGIIIILLIIIIGYVTINEFNKADTKVPYINSHIQKANDEYNQAVDFLNKKNYTNTIQHINESYKEYMLAKENTEEAMAKSIKTNQSLQVQYFNYTITELDYKINATVEMYNGLDYVKSNPSKALSLFRNSEKNMENAKEYSDKRSLLEEQYPDNFLKE